jgi:hypothetical protein
MSFPRHRSVALSASIGAEPDQPGASDHCDGQAGYVTSINRDAQRAGWKSPTCARCNPDLMV